MTDSIVNPNEGSTPFDSGYLKVSELHSLYYEQHGNKNGKPVVYLHGGPGGRATVNSSLTFFDLSVYRVVLYDQRGAGKSLPFAELRDNTTELLVQDIDTLRMHLSILKWHTVFGGSWGSTLGIMYAQTYPEAVSSLVLRGIFLSTDEELDWVFGTEAPMRHGFETIFPDKKARWLQHLIDAGEDTTDPVSSYYRLLTHEDPDVLKAAAREWTRMETSVITLRDDPERVASELEDEGYLIPVARLEVSYFKNRSWLRDGQLLEKEGIDKMKSIPTMIVQGRYDAVCPPRYAWKLYQALGGEKNSNCELVFTIAGHDRFEPETAKKLIEVCKRYGEMDFN